ncbi:MAG: hypothetical protein ACXAEU_19785 [Candidatus Hodarchaeales archaeon]|jgi:hypothetical protein
MKKDGVECDYLVMVEVECDDCYKKGQWNLYCSFPDVEIKKSGFIKYIWSTNYLYGSVRCPCKQLIHGETE